MYTPHSSGPADNVDFTTSDGLRALLQLLAAGGPAAWRTHPLATELMRYTQAKYVPLARAWHRDPAETMGEAFLAMQTASVINAADPWASITRAVELAIAAETHAERLLTSADKARRPQFRPDEYPVRAGDYEEFFYHVLTANAPDRDPAVTVEKVVRSSSIFLVMTGWRAATVEQAVEYICHRLTSLANTQSGLDVLRKDHAFRLRLGMDAAGWTGLLRLLLGPRTRKPDTAGDWSKLGIFARLLLGDTTDDLIRDSKLKARSRQLSGASS